MQCFAVFVKTFFYLSRSCDLVGSHSNKFKTNYKEYDKLVILARLLR